MPIAMHKDVHRWPKLLTGLVVITALGLWGLAAHAADPDEDVGSGTSAVGEDDAQAPAIQPIESTEQPTDDVMEQLLQQRQAPPAVAPQREPRTQSIPSRVGMPAAEVDLNPAVIGVAPGQDQPDLRREGEFIVNRLGRLVRSQDGLHVLFVFEADDKDSPEPPMILQECRYLEAMENIVQQRGDLVVFKVSGQIHTYRGANYLLPTMMTVELEKNNLQP